VGELFPLLAGVFAASVAVHLATRTRRAAWIAAISVAFGTTATVLNGEEWFLIPVDTAIVALGALMTLAGTHLLARVARFGGRRAAASDRGMRNG